MCPLAINMYYRCGAPNDHPELFSAAAQPLRPDTPQIHTVTVAGVVAQGCRASAGFIAGLPESPVRGLVLRNCTFSTDEQNPASPDESDMYQGLPPVTEKSFRIVNAEQPKFEQVTITGPAKPFLWG
jgi:hypothetical protein